MSDHEQAPNGSLDAETLHWLGHDLDELSEVLRAAAERASELASLMWRLAHEARGP